MSYRIQQGKFGFIEQFCKVDGGKTVTYSAEQVTGGSNAPKYILFEICIQKLQGFKVVLVDDPKLTPTWEPDGKVVDTMRINMHSLCKILGCWFWHHLPYVILDVFIKTGWGF